MATKLTWSQTIIKNIEKYGKPSPQKTGLMNEWAKKRTTVIDKPYPKKKK